MHLFGKLLQIQKRAKYEFLDQNLLFNTAKYLTTPNSPSYEYGCGRNGGEGREGGLGRNMLVVIEMPAACGGAGKENEELIMYTYSHQHYSVYVKGTKTNTPQRRLKMQYHIHCLSTTMFTAF